MSLRWRYDGTLLCGAKSSAQDRDAYIDDRLHYHLSLTGAIEPAEDEATTGKWYWRPARPPYWDNAPASQTTASDAGAAAASLERISEIIEHVDLRCRAGDGDVPPTLSEMQQSEISAIYALAMGHAEDWRPGEEPNP